MNNQSSTLAEKIRSIPPVTRFFTISTLAVCFVSALTNFELDKIVFFFPDMLSTLAQARKQISYSSYPVTIYIILKVLLQSYRFFSTFLIPLGIAGQPLGALMDVYFFYTFLSSLESAGKFKGSFPDCLWFVLVSGVMILCLSFVYSLLIDYQHFFWYHQMLLSCITYIWSRSMKNTLINFLGIIPIKAYYLPLFNLFLKLVVDGKSACVDTALGIFGGYLYQCWQSDTLPIYNLFPGSYASFLTRTSDKSGRRVGTLQNETQVQGSNAPGSLSDDWIEDSIFDKGYLKAPLWLYSLLNYPQGVSSRSTAFVVPKNPRSSAQVIHRNTHEDSAALSTGFSWFGSNNKSAFVGKGHRLGG